MVIHYRQGHPIMFSDGILGVQKVFGLSCRPLILARSAYPGTEDNHIGII